jgi:hypothetical protein
LYFLRILEDYKNFWAFKRNKKTKEKCHTETGRTFGPWPDAVGSAHSQGSAHDHRAVGIRGGAVVGGGLAALAVQGQR